MTRIHRRAVTVRPCAALGVILGLAYGVTSSAENRLQASQYNSAGAISYLGSETILETTGNAVQTAGTRFVNAGLAVSQSGIDFRSGVIENLPENNNIDNFPSAPTDRKLTGFVVFEANAVTSSLRDSSGVPRDVTGIDGPVRYLGTAFPSSFTFPTVDRADSGCSASTDYKAGLVDILNADSTSKDIEYFWADGAAASDLGGDLEVDLIAVNRCEYWKAQGGDDTTVAQFEYDKDTLHGDYLTATATANQGLRLVGYNDTDNEWQIASDEFAAGSDRESGAMVYRGDFDDFSAFTWGYLNGFATNPTCDDPDGDTLCSDDEILIGLDPNDPDTDGDGVKDNVEVGPDVRSPADFDNEGKIDALDACYPTVGVACLNEDTILVSKTVDRARVELADAMLFTIKLENLKDVSIQDLDVIDQMPAGLVYLPNTVSVVQNGAPLPSSAYSVRLENGLIIVDDVDIAERGNVEVSFRAEVSIGLDVGFHKNFAWGGLSGTRVSNVGEVEFARRATGQFDCATVIGQVFRDRNSDGYQDAGEPGIPAARLTALVDGSILTVRTDAEGRYHLPCAMTPNATIGSNIVIKLDERTLPSGYRMTSENPRSIRLTTGKAAKANFGASIERIVRADFNQCIFGSGSLNLTAQAQNGLSVLVDTMNQGPAILRLSYRAYDSESEALVQQRIDVVKNAITQLHKQSRGQHEFEIEIEGIRVRGTAAPNCQPVSSGAASQQPQQPSGLPEGSVPVDPASFGITEDKPGYTLWKSPSNRLFWVRD